MEVSCNSLLEDVYLYMYEDKQAEISCCRPIDDLLLLVQLKGIDANLNFCFYPYTLTLTLHNNDGIYCNAKQK